MAKAPTKIITKKSKAAMKEEQKEKSNRISAPSYKKDRKHKTFKALMKV